MRQRRKPEPTPISRLVLQSRSFRAWAERKGHRRDSNIPMRARQVSRHSNISRSLGMPTKQRCFDRLLKLGTDLRQQCRDPATREGNDLDRKVLAEFRSAKGECPAFTGLASTQGKWGLAAMPAPITLWATFRNAPRPVLGLGRRNAPLSQQSRPRIKQGRPRSARGRWPGAGRDAPCRPRLP